MQQQQVSSDELLKMAMDVIDRFGKTTYEIDGEPITEEINGVERKIIVASISRSDDSGTVLALRTLEGDYLKVESTSNNVDQPDLPFSYGEAMECFTALEVRDGETIEFQSKYARYALRELTTLSQGETTESRKEEQSRYEESQERWYRLGHIFTKEQSLQTITSKEANPILDHMDDVLNRVSELAELYERSKNNDLPSDVLQDASSDLAAIAERPGFNQLAPDILQRFDALQNRSATLQDQIESTEVSSVNDLLERSISEAALANDDQDTGRYYAVNLNDSDDIQQKISKEELQVLATNFVERSCVFIVLKDQANDLWRVGKEEEANNLRSEAGEVEYFAFNDYQNALKGGATQEDWNAAVDLADAELSQNHAKDVAALYHAKDVATLSIEVLNSHESSNVVVGNKHITFKQGELNVTNQQTGHFLKTTLSEEGKWEAPISYFNTPELVSFKQQLSDHLSDRAPSDDLGERQKEYQPGRQKKSTALELD